MTSIYVTVSIKLCPKAANDEYIVECIFCGRRVGGFEVIGGGGTSEPPLLVVVCLFSILDHAMQDFPSGQNLR